MSKITASADISVLDFSVLLDISTAIPSARVTNLSTVINANNLQWIFEFTSPSGTPIHVGDFSIPDIDGVPFTDYDFTEQIPQILRQMEFGQDPYTVKVSVRDLAGNVFDLSYGASICKPNGNNGKNNFGAAEINVEVKCAQGQVLVTDKTNLIYKNLVGTKVTSSIKLTYPNDEEGNTLAPVTVTSIPALLPIKYEGEGHEIYTVHVYDYALNPNFTVRIRYYFSKVFAVWCNVTLQPLFCEIDKVVDSLQKCQDSPDSREKQKELTIINGKMVKAFTGIIEPLSGIDVPGVVNEIKGLLGVDCECCRPSGISNVGIALATDALFTANKVCGDMLLTWENDGNGNIVLNYQNASYSFFIDPLSDSEAFSYSQTISGCNKQTFLKVDIAVLSAEILTAIQANQGLLSILNGITQKAQLSCSGLDGGDAFDFSTCDYSVELDTTVSGKVFESILIGGTSYPAPTGTLLIDSAAIQSFLNSLSKGGFIATYSSLTNKTTITSSANSNIIATVTTSIGAVNTITAVSNNCGLICNILQRILNYMNGLNLLQIKTGVGITICRFNADGTVLSKVFADTASASDVSIYMADSICNIANYLKTRLLSCENLKGIFGAYLTTMGLPTAGDTMPIWFNGVCIQLPLKVLALAVFRLLRTDIEVKSEYCLVTPCSTVSACSPVTSLAGTGGDTSWTYNWAVVAGAIGYKWSLDGTTWNVVTSTSALLLALTADTAYTFRVYPVYPAGDGVSCVVSDVFTTTNTGAVCSAPASIVLDNVTDTSIRATWAAVAGATGYQYRVNGGSWINTGGSLTVNITGLDPETLYTIDVRAIIGGVTCTETISDDATTIAAIPINTFIENTGSAVVVNGFTSAGTVFFTPSTGSFALFPGDDMTGIHPATFTGALRLVIASGSFTAHADLYVNSVFIECIALVVGSGNNFTSATYNTSDEIHVVIADGACGA